MVLFSAWIASAVIRRSDQPESELAGHFKYLIDRASGWDDLESGAWFRRE